MRPSPERPDARMSSRYPAGPQGVTEWALDKCQTPGMACLLILLQICCVRRVFYSWLQYAP